MKQLNFIFPLTRNMDTQESRDFWERLERSAAEFDKWAPSWLKEEANKMIVGARRRARGEIDDQ